MTGLSVSVEHTAESIHHELWSREPYRRIDLALIVSNDSPARVSFGLEILFPEDSVFNFSGDRWRPDHRTEVDGAVYDVWTTISWSASVGYGWISVAPKVHSEEKLTVDLKPYLTSILLRWRVFTGHDEQESSDWGQAQLDFAPYVPSI